jgi:hypothetical protein
VIEMQNLNSEKPAEATTRITYEDLEPGSTATPFSRFFWAAYRDDWATATAQLAEDIEWDMMSNNQIRKGLTEVMPFLRASKYASAKEPVPILNRADKEWGVWEYWNVGTISAGIVEFAKQSKWPFPADISRVIGETYKVPVCFVYHINAKGQIDLLREYVDVGSVIAQFK